MDHEYLLWIMLFSYALHILEEYVLNWRDWAIKQMHFEVDWPVFYVTNAIVVVGGICTAIIGWKLPAFSLAFPALALVNAVFLHIVPTIAQRHFSPGLLTGILLFLPIGFACYWGAAADGVLDEATLTISAIGGVVLMAYPIILLKLKPKLGIHE